MKCCGLKLLLFFDLKVVWVDFEILLLYYFYFLLDVSRIIVKNILFIFLFLFGLGLLVLVEYDWMVIEFFWFYIDIFNEII